MRQPYEEGESVASNPARGAGLDTATLKALYDQHAAAVFNYIYYQVASQAVAEAVTRQVFLKIHAELPGMPRQADLKVRLLQAAQDLLTRESDLGPPASGESVCPGPSHSRVRADLKATCDAIARLPQLSRQVILLSVIAGCRYRSIASILRRSPQVVLAKKSRALLGMKDAIQFGQPLRASVDTRS